MTARVRSACALLGLTICTLLARPAWSGEGASANEFDETVLPMTVVLTHGGTEKALERMRHSVEQAKQVQDELRAKLAGSLKGKPSSTRRAGRKLIEESKEVSAEHARELSWLQKLQGFAKVVDITSTGAKVVAYLAEGDTEGAKFVVIDDLCKKACSAGGAAMLSFIPGVGTIAGATMGEEAYKKYLAPKLAKREQELRERAALAENRTAWLPPKEMIIDSRGNVRVLSRDVYYDPATRTLKHRSPQEQARWEERKRREFFDGRKLIPIREAYLAGRLSRSEYLRAVEDFKNRDPTKVWTPPKLEYTDAKEGGAPRGGGQRILERVRPVRVTARGGDSDGTLTLSFWNVGALAPGYGGVTAVTSHRNGTETAHGTFSGGPNGKFSFVVEGEKVTLRLVDGRTVRRGSGVLTVQNPSAFANWPDDL